MNTKPNNDRKSELPKALFDAIKSSGVSLPGYERIAEKAGMTRQLVRHYYADPEELAVNLCDMLAATYRDCLMKGILEADSAQRLTVFLDFYFNFLAEKGLPKPQDDEVYDAMLAFASTSGKVRQNLHDQYALLQMTLAHEIQITYPNLPQDRCRELGFMIVITMYGHWKMVATLGFSDEYNTVSRDALDRLIESYINQYAAADANSASL